MLELKECPFCGGKASICERYRHGVANRKMYWIECLVCGVSQYHGDIGGYRTPSKAARAWNKRRKDGQERNHAEVDDG